MRNSPLYNCPGISTIKQHITQRLQLERLKSKNKTLLRNHALIVFAVVNNYAQQNNKRNEQQAQTAARHSGAAQEPATAAKDKREQDRQGQAAKQTSDSKGCRQVRAIGARTALKQMQKHVYKALSSNSLA